MSAAAARRLTSLYETQVSLPHLRAWLTSFLPLADCAKCKGRGERTCLQCDGDTKCTCRCGDTHECHECDGYGVYECDSPTCPVREARKGRSWKPWENRYFVEVVSADVEAWSLFEAVAGLRGLLATVRPHGSYREGLEIECGGQKAFVYGFAPGRARRKGEEPRHYPIEQIPLALVAAAPAATKPGKARRPARAR